ncbi:hypothetical protein IE81DRAFT_327278 [Ceraceosorus guamensis]|uniref:Uncharacterized protein n=1 Tax=Ceraceosorus guamensis TaxID=1522189 RepID=A0A316VNK5_9BASI|nr:hypothetical protein IE81DRAFT_327278 [Ceraceosorus guamensis]PWN38648.1 hypothetical protein IE81DRAFT_327278 [Ceraceosorus guamensis]
MRRKFESKQHPHVTNFDVIFSEKSSLTGQMERKTGIKMVRFDICEPVSSDSAVHLPSALDMLKEEELENPPGTLYTVPRPHLVLPFDQEFRRMDRLRPALFAPSESRSGKNDGPSESRSGGNDAHRDGLQIEPLRGLHGLTIELSTRNLTRGVPASRTDMLKELGEETMDLSREDEEYFARALERCGKKKRIRSSRMMELQLEEESDEIMDASSSEEEQFATQAHDEHDEARRTASADEVQAAFDALAQHVSQAEGFDVDAMGMECVRDDQDFDFAFDTPHPDTHPDLDVHHGGHGLYVDQQQACANSMDTQSGGAEESCGTCAAEEQDEEVLGLSRGGAMALAEDFWRPLQDPEKYWADISLTRRAESV